MRQARDPFVMIYERLTADPRISASHFSLCMALLYEWQRGRQQNPFAVSRKKLMQLAHINSRMTYHKMISQLHEFGYIRYVPSYHPKLGSRVTLIF